MVAWSSSWMRLIDPPCERSLPTAMNSQIRCLWSCWQASVREQSCWRTQRLAPDVVRKTPVKAMTRQGLGSDEGRTRRRRGPRSPPTG
uniref:Uncharacterized protein n=1 Tax=Triticum urartu TaxID=4572 RepID=A0A8R7P0T0_TRIUA